MAGARTGYFSASWRALWAIAPLYMAEAGCPADAAHRADAVNQAQRRWCRAAMVVVHAALSPVLHDVPRSVFRAAQGVKLPARTAVCGR
jgi:hypothetical protein